ncbi:hypothetical protein JXQ31_13465 [candidate division KSB1 bacterium]|nr:hypothetical protein [candidate division KSB1 bacterium]
MQNITTIIIILVFIFITLTIFFLTFLRLRKRGGNLTTVLFGAIYEFFNLQQREQVEQVVEHKSTPAQTEQDSAKEQEKIEQHEQLMYEKKLPPATKNIIQRFTPRKLMRK